MIFATADDGVFETTGVAGPAEDLGVLSTAPYLGPLLAGLLYVRDPALPLVFAAIVGTAIVVWLVRFGGTGQASGVGA